MIESEWKMVTLTSGNGKSGQSLLVLKLGNRFKVKIDAATGVSKQKISPLEYIYGCVCVVLVWRN